MKLEINEKGSDSFYKETVNVAAQARKLIQRPDGKIKDYFRSYLIDLILCAAFIVILLVMGFAWGFKTLDFVAIALLAVVAFMCAAYLIGLNRAFRSLCDEWKPSVLTLDENGIEISKEGGTTVRAAWNSIVVVRDLKNSLNIISSDTGGFTLSVADRYKTPVLDWLKENRPDVKIIG